MLELVIREHRTPLGDGACTRMLEVDGAGPPLLLLHGFSDSADTWRPLLLRLERAGRRAVAIDLPGFGNASDARPGAILPQFDAAISAGADRAGVFPPPLLVGNSMGGLAALHFANRHLVGLAGVVPVCTAGLHHPIWIRIMVSPALRPLLPKLGSRPLKDAAAAVLRRDGRLADETREPARRYLGHLSPPRIAHQISIADRLLSEQEYPLEMGSIESPVLFIWGAQDRIAAWRLNASRLLRMAERAPGARNEVIPKCGHTPQLQAPGRLLTILEDFCPADPVRAAGRPTDVRPPADGRFPKAGGY